MVELEKAIIPSYSDKIKPWKRSVDDTIAFVKTDAIKNALSSLKLVFANFYKIFIFAPNDNPSKTMENVFYFI